MSARRQQVQVFSTAFLDLLSCGMGAMIILWVSFVAASGSGEGPVFSACVVGFELGDSASGGPNPWELRVSGETVAECRRENGAWIVRAYDESGTREVGPGEPLSTVGNPTLSVTSVASPGVPRIGVRPATMLAAPRVDRKESITLFFRRARADIDVSLRIWLKPGEAVSDKFSPDRYATPAGQTRAVPAGGSLPDGGWALAEASPRGQTPASVAALPEVRILVSTPRPEVGAVEEHTWGSPLLEKSAGPINLTCRVSAELNEVTIGGLE